MSTSNQDLKDLVRTIPDYPKPGILFRDMTTLLGHAEGFKKSIDRLCDLVRSEGANKVAGIEARGFILGGAMATQLGCAFIPVRKKGKLPHDVVGRDYELEYGVDRVEIHTDAVEKGDKIIVVDDLIATGGTAFAAIELLEHSGAKVTHAVFLIDLPDLAGRKRIEARGTPTSALIAFEGH